MSDATPNFKAPKKKRKKSQSLTVQCDTLFGQIIRSRGACEDCGKVTDLQAAHGFSRRYRAVRWDERNCFALDRGCHLKYTVRPLEWDEWLRNRWGEDLYTELRELALHGRNPDLKETLARLQERHEQIGRAA